MPSEIVLNQFTVTYIAYSNISIFQIYRKKSIV